jgi:hypothetical protein
MMSIHERNDIKKQFRRFTAKHFKKPSHCRNIHQIRFYVAELSLKIDELKKRFNYVPDNAYSLLSQYNATQNSLLLSDFVKDYGYNSFR